MAHNDRKTRISLSLELSKPARDMSMLYNSQTIHNASDRSQ